MRTSKIVIGTVAGLAAGAIAGILFAPEKGSTTRKQIKDKSNDYVGKLRESITQKSESIKRDAERLVGKGRENFDNAKNEVKNAAAKFKQDVAAGNDPHGKFSFNDQTNKEI